MKSSDEGDEYVGPHEVAHVLRLSPMTVIRWAAHGRLGDSVALDGHRRFLGEDIEALADQRKRKKDGGD
jgi:predicted site-specific integrase-resolvase